MSSPRLLGLACVGALCVAAPGAALADPPVGGADPLQTVSDPMLQPSPAPAKVLGSWLQGARIVRASSPAIRTALARVEQAEGLSRQALGVMLPSLAVSGNLNQHLLLGHGTAFLASGVEAGTSIPQPALTGNANLGLAAPILAPRAWFDRATAGKVIESARASSKNAERITLAALADAIVGVVMAERLAEISRLSLRSALAVLDLTDRSVKLGGRATRLDVLRAEQEVSTSRTQLLRANEALLQAREGLGAVLGESIGWGWRWT